MATERELVGIDEEIRKLEEKKQALRERWREEIAADLDAAGAAARGAARRGDRGNRGPSQRGRTGRALEQKRRELPPWKESKSKGESGARAAAEPPGSA